MSNMSAYLIRCLCLFIGFKSLTCRQRGTAVGDCDFMAPTSSLLVLDEDEHPHPQALPLLDPLAVAAADGEYVEKKEGAPDAHADKSKQVRQTP